jgi:MFS superfamily sulfate permease-like transporter
MNKNLIHDIAAGVVVYLVALPLCLGIALASGAPLLSGIIAGIIGGLVIGLISESNISVSGPAAGLSAIVLSAITQIGSFDLFLLAVLLAGALQLLAGFLKAGAFANYIPSSIIKGLLTAIGLILIINQIPYAAGYEKENAKNLIQLKEEGASIIEEIIHVFEFLSWGPIIISFVSLVTLFFWHKTPFKKFSFLPASLIVVLMGVFINKAFQIYLPEFSVSKGNLVNIPIFKDLTKMVTIPNFTQIGNFVVWKVAFTIAIVASVETLLNLEAVENIDPQKRKASPNKELMAQGIGNMLSGLVGGIPITSVIVRSSVNINAGAQTKLSTILHGLLLLISVVFLSTILNLIPLASLASILLVTGFKLARISKFKELYKNGLNQFIPYIITIIAILFTDLLIGIIAGSLSHQLYLLKRKYL